jgi:hypothetical protein
MGLINPGDYTAANPFPHRTQDASETAPMPQKKAARPLGRLVKRLKILYAASTYHIRRGAPSGIRSRVRPPHLLHDRKENSSLSAVQGFLAG